jgi:hypothetical protein
MKNLKKWYHLFLRHPQKDERNMWKAGLATMVSRELDVSRPVTFLIIGENMEGVLKEVLTAVSPTSRVLVMEGVGKDEEDERVEKISGGFENISDVMYECRVLRFDAVIYGCVKKNPEAQKMMLQKSESLLKPSGLCIIFPFFSELRVFATKLFSETKEMMVWDRLPPIRLFIGKRGG